MAAGALLLVGAFAVQTFSTPRTPLPLGTVPQGPAAPAAAAGAVSGGGAAGTLVAGRAGGGSSAGYVQGSGSGARTIRFRAARAPVPAGKLAPVALVLPGRPAAPVIPQGVTAGRLDIPEAVGTLGWWTGGAGMEAAAGSIVIAGHVDSGSQGKGYLAALRELPVGARIVLRGVGGAGAPDRTFAVAARRTYLKSEGLPASVFDQSVQARLVLITCTGPFDPTTRSYPDNLVVYAVPVPATAAASTPVQSLVPPPAPSAVPEP